MTLHDLPPRWDGHTVEWAPQWAQLATSLSLHLEDFGACEECGSVQWRLTRSGSYRAPDPQQDTTPPTRPDLQPHRLTASRCQDCAHTTITEITTGKTWTIDATDLTDDGSYDETTPQLTLF